MHNVLKWTYQLLKKVIAAVQATTNDQVVLQLTMGSLPLYLFEKLLKVNTISVLSQIMITISMLKTKIFAFKTYLTGSKRWDH
jgi:6-phosphogluconolactonase/glucosamine-6-phosphate isomerase/deaminase